MLFTLRVSLPTDLRWASTHKSWCSPCLQHTHKHIFTANWQQVLLQSVLEQYRNHLPTRFILIQLAYHLHWLIHKNMTHNIISEWVSSCQIKSLTDKLMLNRCLGIVTHCISCKLEVGVREPGRERERETVIRIRLEMDSGHFSCCQLFALQWWGWMTMVAVTF